MMTMTMMIRSVALPAVCSTVMLGQAPEGWRLGGGGIPEHYEVSLDKQIKRTGQASANLRSKTDQPAVRFGNLMQSVSADEYRGKRVRLAAYLQTAGNEQGAFMWLRANTPTASRLDNMGDRLIKNAADWRRAEIVMNIPDDAHTLSFGFGLFGGGKAWVDDVSLEVVGEQVPITTTLKDRAEPDEGKKNQESVEKRKVTTPKALTNPGFEN